MKMHHRNRVVIPIACPVEGSETCDITVWSGGLSSGSKTTEKWTVKIFDAFEHIVGKLPIAEKILVRIPCHYCSAILILAVEFNSTDENALEDSIPSSVIHRAELYVESDPKMKVRGKNSLVGHGFSLEGKNEVNSSLTFDSKGGVEDHSSGIAPVGALRSFASNRPEVFSKGGQPLIDDAEKHFSSLSLEELAILMASTPARTFAALPSGHKGGDLLKKTLAHIKKRSGGEKLDPVPGYVDLWHFLAKTLSLSGDPNNVAQGLGIRMATVSYWNFCLSLLCSLEVTAFYFNRLPLFLREIKFSSEEIFSEGNFIIVFPWLLLLGSFFLIEIMKKDLGVLFKKADPNRWLRYLGQGIVITTLASILIYETVLTVTRSLGFNL